MKKILKVRKRNVQSSHHYPFISSRGAFEIVTPSVYIESVSEVCSLTK